MADVEARVARTGSFDTQKAYTIPLVEREEARSDIPLVDSVTARRGPKIARSESCDFNSAVLFRSLLPRPRESSRSAGN